MFVTTRKNTDVLLAVYVQPKSSKNKIVSIFDDAVKVAITAPPVDGKANKALVSFLAGFFHLSKKDVQISSGLQSRRKKFALTGITEEEVRHRVLEQIQ